MTTILVGTPRLSRNAARRRTLVGAKLVSTVIYNDFEGGSMRDARVHAARLAPTFAQRSTFNKYQSGRWLNREL